MHVQDGLILEGTSQQPNASTLSSRSFCSHFASSLVTATSGRAPNSSCDILSLPNHHAKRIHGCSQAYNHSLSMSVLEHLYLWLTALRQHFNDNEGAKCELFILHELTEVAPSDADAITKCGSELLLTRLKLAIFSHISNFETLEVLLSEKLGHLPQLESFLRVALLTPIRLELEDAPLASVDLLRYRFPGNVAYLDSEKCVIDTSILGVIRGARIWKELEVRFAPSVIVASLTCNFENDVLDLLNGSNGVSLASFPTRSNCVSEFCADWGHAGESAIRFIRSHGDRGGELILGVAS